MVAALVTETIIKEITPALCFEFVKAKVTTTGDWYVSKLSKMTHVFISEYTRKPTGVLKATWSNTTMKVTITATGNDYVNLLIVGEK